MPGPGLSFIGEEEKKLVLDALENREINRYRFHDEDDNVDDNKNTAKPSRSKVFHFEREFETYLGVRHVIGMNSCTSATYAGLMANGIGPGDEVIVPGYTFIATVASVVYTGATPVFAEVDDSLTIDPGDVLAKITPRTKAVLCVHMMGAPCNMSALAAIAEEKNILLIEDVAQACGGSFEGKKLGAFGIFGAFSLNVFKTMTAGDGGIFSTDSDTVFENAYAIHDHGFKSFRASVVDGSVLLGLNLRMHELTGAVALAQARKLDRIIGTMRNQKSLFLKEIGDVPHAKLRRLNDPSGECGSLIVFTFDSKDIAETVARALGTITLIQSKKHYYGHFVTLAHQENEIGNRWMKNFTNPVSAFAQGMLPQTDDILGRSVALSVGVSDAYLGAAFGIEVTSSIDEIKKRGEEFRYIVKRCLG